MLIFESVDRRIRDTYNRRRRRVIYIFIIL